MNKDNHVTHFAIQQETPDLMMRISDDGFIRLTFNDLINTSLSHLISIHEETRLSAPYTHLFGYTEWVSTTVPVLSVGWDWKLSHDDRLIKIVRIGQPRSNLMIIDNLHRDIGQDNTEVLINQKIDMTAWEVSIKEQILKADHLAAMVLSYS